MNIRAAQQFGVQAFQAGAKRAPAAHKPFMDALKAGPVVNLADMLSGWLHGWDIANLAQGENDPRRPSVVELQRITRTHEFYVYDGVKYLGTSGKCLTRTEALQALEALVDTLWPQHKGVDKGDILEFINLELGLTVVPC